MQPIFLIGPPGSGKTACGQALAHLLARQFHDTDRLIEHQQGRTVKEIFAAHGEAHFRALERALLDDIPVLHQRQPVVIATGGGLPVFNDNMEKLLQMGHVIALDADLKTLVERLRGGGDRPLLRNTSDLEDKNLHQNLAQLISRRSPVYSRAGYKIDTSGLSPDQVAQKIYRIIVESESSADSQAD